MARKILALRMSRAERAQLRRLARATKQPMAAVVRRLIVNAATKEPV